MTPVPSLASGGLARGDDGFMRRTPDARDPAAPLGASPALLPAKWLDRPLIARFDDVAARFAGRIAVEDGRNRLTYAELAARVDAFAARIAAQSGPVERAIVVFARADVSFPAVALALLALGRVFTPIDVSAPADRRQAVIDQTAPGLVLVTDPEDAALAPPNVAVVSLQDAPPAARPAAIVDVDAPAGLVFTSGSTGQAKGVAGCQRGYMHTLAEYVGACAITEEDTILSIATLSAIGSREVLAAAVTGARLRILDFQKAGVAGALEALSETTVLSFVPSAMRMVMGVPGIETYAARLRVLSLLGEPVLASDLAMFRSRLPDTCRICIELGTTETTTVIRWFVRPEIIGGAVSPSGYLVPGPELLLSGDDGGPAQAGEAGELTVRGPSVALGLWRDGRLATDAFRPAGRGSHARIYATGDLLRLRPDGLFEFVGRRDRMVKLRGLQVDLAEVEAAMRDWPGVEDAVAAVVKGSGGGRLVGYVVAASAVPAAELRRHIEARTARHMAPQQIVQLNAIPRLANFKPDLVRLEAEAAKIG